MRLNSYDTPPTTPLLWASKPSGRIHACELIACLDQTAWAHLLQFEEIFDDWITTMFSIGNWSNKSFGVLSVSIEYSTITIFGHHMHCSWIWFQSMIELQKLYPDHTIYSSSKRSLSSWWTIKRNRAVMRGYAVDHWECYELMMPKELRQSNLHTKIFYRHVK